MKAALVSEIQKQIKSRLQTLIVDRVVQEAVDSEEAKGIIDDNVRLLKEEVKTFIVKNFKK